MKPLIYASIALVTACRGPERATPTVPVADTRRSNAPLALDAASVTRSADESPFDAGSSESISEGTHGAICAVGTRDRSRKRQVEVVACGPELACCYPCGIAGCVDQCMVTCSGPGCFGGCGLFP